MTDFCLGSPATVRIVSRIHLLNRMSVRAGISCEAHQHAGPASWYEARLRCLGCTFGAQCERVLATSHRAGGDRVPNFCANRNFFNGYHLGGSDER